MKSANLLYKGLSKRRCCKSRRVSTESGALGDGGIKSRRRLVEEANRSIIPPDQVPRSKFKMVQNELVVLERQSFLITNESSTEVFFHS